MDDLISRRELFKRIRMFEEEYKDKLKGTAYVKFLIRDAPTVDAHPVKHGRWIRHGKPEDYFWNCSECKNWIIYAEHDLHKHHFCGNCGCRMDGDSDD